MNKYLTTIIIALTIISILLLATHHETRSTILIPHCEEDEVLIANDFPYTDASNLHCEHIDAIAASINS